MKTALGGALHQKSGFNTRNGSSILNKTPPLVVACNFGAKPARERTGTVHVDPGPHPVEIRRSHRPFFYLFQEVDIRLLNDAGPLHRF